MTLQPKAPQDGSRESSGVRPMGRDDAGSQVSGPRRDED